MKNDALVVILAVAIILILSFATTAGLLWLACWAFKWTWWSWRIAFGVWVVLLILGGVFKQHGGHN